MLIHRKPSESCLTNNKDSTSVDIIRCIFGSGIRNINSYESKTIFYQQYFIELYMQVNTQILSEELNEFPQSEHTCLDQQKALSDFRSLLMALSNFYSLPTCQR